MADSPYDPRYLGGVLFFNDADFFEAHEVWEDLWAEASGPERRLVQGLIQAAVGLLHFGNGNLRGAVKLYHSSRGYLEAFAGPFLGLDVTDFRGQMDRCFAAVLAAGPDSREVPAAELLPVIRLEPPPAAWPQRSDFEKEDRSNGGDP